MIIALVLFENEFLNIVAISFTALILNELIMVALEITIWYVYPVSSGALMRTVASTRHVYMIISEVVTLGIYGFSMIFLPEYFGAFCLRFFPSRAHALHTRLSRFVVCSLRAVRMESCGDCRNQRITIMDHQGDQEPRRAGGHDEALASLSTFQSHCHRIAPPVDVYVTYCNRYDTQADGHFLFFAFCMSGSSTTSVFV
jgi:hypothetical protein